MKGYFKNNGVSAGGKIIAGCFPSASHAPSLFSTCNSVILRKPPLNGVPYTGLNFKYAHFTSDKGGYFDFVPGAWGRLNTSLTVGDYGYWKVKKRDGSFTYYPSDDATIEGLTICEPLFQVRVYFNDGTASDELPPPISGNTMWKLNKRWASLPGEGKMRATEMCYDPSGEIALQGIPNVSIANYPDAPLPTQAEEIGAVWSTTNIGYEDGKPLYPSISLKDLPLEIASGVGSATTVSRFAYTQPDAPTTGGAMKVAWRLAWYPLSIIDYYADKLGEQFPYL